jgi:hypothetical protein
MLFLDLVTYLSETVKRGPGADTPDDDVSKYLRGCPKTVTPLTAVVRSC